MSVYHTVQKLKYRVTLEIEAFNDFDPHQIDWNKVLELQGGENVESYVEDLSCPDRW